MSQLDRVKERINLLKYWIGVLLAALLAASSWLFNNVETLPMYKIILVSIIILGFVVMIASLNNRLLKRIDSLEDL